MASTIFACLIQIIKHFMHRLVFYFFYIGINFFRLVPFFLLYLMSWKVYVILYYIIGYRKKVVCDNLRQSFPDKSGQEINKICKAFYKQNLAPIFAEGLKGFTMSHKQFQSRYVVKNPELLDEYFKNDKSVIALATHFCNWEWGVQSVDAQIKHQAAALYKPMSNPFVEKYSKGLREKFGMKLVSIFDTRAYFEEKKEKPVVYIMAADQSPSNITKAHWVKFLGRDTACLHGPESYAKFNNLPVIFFDVVRVKRGFYEMTIKKVTDEPQNCNPGEITQKYMDLLSEAIHKKPENWLWSHKRWKHKR